MARAKVLTVKQTDVMRLEGCAQQLAEMDAQYRPKAEAVDYIAQQLGVGRRLVMEWVRLTRPATHRSDTAGAFFSVYERIASLLSERLYANVWAMAAPGERDGFRAAQWLLPRIDPERFDPSVQEAQDDDDDVFDTANVDQSVFDAMSDAERERLAELRATVLAAMEAYETLVKTVQHRVFAEELAERETVAH